MSDENNSTALVIQQEDRLPAARTIASGSLVRAFVPANFGEAMQIARIIGKSGMAPKSYQDNEAKILVGMMVGAECGLTPMQSLRGVAVIGNQPSLWGDVALGLVVSSGLVEDMVESDSGNFDDLQNGDGEAICTIKRRGRATPVIRRFGMAMARRAGLLTKQGPWASGHRQRMCQMRARAFALRDLFPDILAGLGVEGAQEDSVEPSLREQAERASSSTIIATVTDLEHQARGELPTMAAVEATDTMERAAHAVQEEARANIDAGAEQQQEAAPKRRVRTPKAAGAPNDGPPAKKLATPQQIAEMQTLQAMFREYDEAGNMRVAGDVKSQIGAMREKIDFSELDGATTPPPATVDQHDDLAPGVAEVLTDQGYDLNKDDPAPEGMDLQEAVRELKSKELLPDVQGFVVVGLSEEDRMEFESIKARHIAGMIEDAKRRR